MHWFWQLLNTPRIQMTVLQDIELSIAFLVGAVLLALGFGFAYHAISRK